MRNGIYKINELTEGTIVEGRDGYSIVKECVHGNKYYAYMGIDMMDAEIDEATSVVSVSDDNTHILDCCN